MLPAPLATNVATCEAPSSSPPIIVTTETMSHVLSDLMDVLGKDVPTAVNQAASVLSTLTLIFHTTSFNDGPRIRVDQCDDKVGRENRVTEYRLLVTNKEEPGGVVGGGGRQEIDNTPSGGALIDLRLGQKLLTTTVALSELATGERDGMHEASYIFDVT